MSRSLCLTLSPISSLTLSPPSVFIKKLQITRPAASRDLSRIGESFKVTSLQVAVRGKAETAALFIIRE